MKKVSFTGWIDEHTKLKDIFMFNDTDSMLIIEESVDYFKTEWCDKKIKITVEEIK